jgi:RimJ/RimL family protein N-acetyltransferase
LEIRTHPDNIASQKVALKSGFTEEGRARGAVLYKDRYIDMCQFSLTRPDFYTNKTDKNK